MKIWLTFALKTYCEKLLETHYLGLPLKISYSNFRFHVVCDLSIFPCDWGWYGRLLISFTSKGFARWERKPKSEKMLHAETYHLSFKLYAINHKILKC